MDKKVLTVFVVFLVGMSIFLSKACRRAQPLSSESPPSVVENQSGAVDSSEGTRGSRGGFSHLGFGGSSVFAMDSARTLTDTEVARVEEALDLTVPMQDFLDDDNETNALKEARSLATHSNPEVRMAALEAMRWIGSSAAPDIPLFFGDDDEAIAQLAEEAFWDAIEEIEDPVLQIKMFEISLGSSSPQLRFDALEKMIYLPDALSFPAMAPMLGDPNESVQDLARENLEFIAEEEFASEAEAMDWFVRNKKNPAGF